MDNAIQLWIDLVKRFSKQSRCKSRQVGAIIVKDNFLIAEGWNSAPSGSTTKDCTRPNCTTKSGMSGACLQQAICVHAEANAIANCAKRGVSTDGASLFCSCLPCAECAKIIIGAGIKNVYYIDHYNSDLSVMMFKNAKVKYEQIV